MFYQETKTARGAAIGTIMPWTGGLTTIPKGWIICDGQSLQASDFPLLAQAIGDTYNAGTSDFNGNPPNNFPNYAGSIKLPNLNGKTLMDIEASYFANTGSGGTGRAADVDPQALLLLDPLIGTNEDAGVTTIFTDVYTDLIFSINDDDRTGYVGRIKGNTLLNGDFFKTVYIGPRKLGRAHVKRHSHSGSYETVANDNPIRPGEGVIPYADVSYTLFAQGLDNWGDNEFAGDVIYFGWTSDISYRGDAPGYPGGSGISDTYSGETSDVVGGVVGGAGFQLNVGTNVGTYVLQWPDGGAYRNGFDQGSPGKTIAKIASEQPPINLKANSILLSPLSRNFLNTPAKSDGQYISGSVPYGFGSQTVTVPPGYTNYWTNSDPTVGDTLMSGTGINFTSNTEPDVINAHSHDEFDVEFDSTRMRPQSNLTASVNLPVSVTLDNVSNRNALQIDFNIAQPRVTSIYIIRAY